MTNSLEHLQDGYFTCFEVTVKTTREVLAHLNEVDVTYIDVVLEAMRALQTTVTLAMTHMQTDDCTIWDAKCSTIDEATTKFGQVYEQSQIVRATAHDSQHEAFKQGDALDPMVKLLDHVLEKMRVAANVAVAAFQKQFQEALLPRVPAQHLPMMVSGAYNTVTQFHMIIWCMVVDECIMPMQHTYLSSFSLATMMQHALEKIPSVCMMNIPPHPPEPNDHLTAFLDSLGMGWLGTTYPTSFCTIVWRCAKHSDSCQYVDGCFSISE